MFVVVIWAMTTANTSSTCTYIFFNWKGLITISTIIKNNRSGTLPPQIAQLTFLGRLCVNPRYDRSEGRRRGGILRVIRDLASIPLSGGIPEEIGSLKHLQYLYVPPLLISVLL
jgi:hypothetical protein